MIFFKKQKTEVLDINPPKVENGKVRSREQYEKFTKKQKKDIKKFPEQVFLITMFYLNDTVKEYVIRTSDKLFSMGKKRDYLLIAEQSKYNLTMKMNQLYYVEDVCVPINKEFLKQKHKNDSEKDNIFMTLTPSNLKEFITMKFVEKVINPIDIEKWLKMAFFASLGAVIFGLINIAISASGAFGGG